MVGNEGLEATIQQIQDATELFSYKWYPAILYTVGELDGASYSHIESVLDGISSKMLSDGLASLCERGLLTTTESVDNSGRDIYILTPKGAGLIPVLDALRSWDGRHGERRASILIVEDEEMIASILSRAVADSYDATVCQTGENLLAEYTDDIDLVILDRRLRTMSGDDVAARIKAQDETAIILAVSGIEPANDIFELAIDDYVHKPFTEEEIRTRIELLLKRTALDGAAREYLSLRSKQAALVGWNGDTALGMQAYQDCKTAIERLDIPPERQQTLESLLYETPGHR